MSSVATARKKTTTTQKEPGWGQRLFKTVKECGYYDGDDDDKYQGVELDADYSYYNNDEGRVISVVVKTDSGAYDTFGLTVATFPSSCGILIAQNLPGWTGPSAAMWPFYFDLLVAAAHKMRYGLVMLTHQKSHASIKEALKYGFVEHDTVHNPNSGNTITLVSMPTKATTDPVLKKLVANLTR